MAAVLDYFSIGSIVWCRTCYNTEIEGEVMAFDPQVKILILKCPSTSGDPKLNNIQFINLGLVSELQVKKEVTSLPEVPQSLNLQRLNTRVRNQVERKRRMLQSISANVSDEGRSLFMAISKTIKEVRWSGPDIEVWNHEVVIKPPYQLANVCGGSNAKGYNYIRKVVEKHMKDLELNAQNNTTSASPSSSLTTATTQVQNVTQQK